MRSATRSSPFIWPSTIGSTDSAPGRPSPQPPASFSGWFHFRPGHQSDITNIDLGYRLRRAAWDKGYATEGSRALIDRGFTDLGVERVFAHTMSVNAASRHVLEKCGLAMVRTIPYKGPFDIEGAEHGEVEYALTKPDWEAAR